MDAETEVSSHVPTSRGSLLFLKCVCVCLSMSLHMYIHIYIFIYLLIYLFN